MKKVQFKDWQIGKRYFVKSGIWQGNLIYCGLQGKKMYPLLLLEILIHGKKISIFTLLNLILVAMK